ncbi:MAG: transglutaminase domain-containing protein [Acidimicrobiales bacterium]
MTIAPDELVERLAADWPPEEPDSARGAAARPAQPVDDGGDTDASPLRPNLVAGAALLATLGGAWMVGGLFRGGMFPRGVMAVGTALGVGLTWLAVTRGRSAYLQAAVVPAAAILGAALVAPAASGGTANLPGLVAEALRSGGLLQPPVPFEPGWRFIGVVLFALTGATALGVATATNKARLAVAVPLPLLIGGALLQPEGGAMAASAVGGFLAISSLALAFGADLPTAEDGSNQFETQRLVRGGGLLAGLMVALVVISQAGFLFPTPDRDQVIPPQRPPTPPTEPDRVLFTVAGAAPGPYRVGVLDEYDGEAFLLPSIDPARITTAAADTGVVEARASDSTVDTIFTIADVRGATLPTPAGTVAVRSDKVVEWDPRTNVARLASGRPRRGFTYTVASARPADGRALSASPPAPDAIRARFASAPPPPNEVITLLADAPPGNFDRIQFIRQRLYNTVVAAGAGIPTEVTPARVAALLVDGAEATPYEITASEVLLARWAGVPARLGFGFYGGEAIDGGALEFRPRHGAAWLEVYFGDIGWVPLVGTPPRAKASLSETEKNEDPNVLATQELALVVFVPVRLSTIELLYERVRFWLSLFLPVLVLLGFATLAWPYAAKTLRRWQRQRWAAERGPAAQIWVAYAEFRDAAFDLNVGDLRRPPLEFLREIDNDAEHEELAWLVTRAVWGDLSRDLRDEDADAAEEMAHSVSHRLATAQTLVNRLIAMASRASLRTPYAPELPHLRLAASASASALTPGAKRFAPLRQRARQALARPRMAVVAVTVVAMAITVAVAPDRNAAPAEAPVRFPATLVDAQIGAFEFVREEAVETNYAKPGQDSLVNAGQVFTIRDGSVVAGSYQVVVLADDVNARDLAVQRRVEAAILTGTFTTRSFGVVRIRELKTPEQQVFLWFPPTTNTMQLFVFRADVAGAASLVERVVSRQLDLPDPRPQSAA